MMMMNGSLLVEEEDEDKVFVTVAVATAVSPFYCFFIGAFLHWVPYHLLMMIPTLTLSNDNPMHEYLFFT